MKFTIAILLIVASIDPGKIGQINTIKSEAHQAYVDGDYKKAIKKYQYLTDSLAVTEDEVMLNLGNSYFQVKDTAHASATYQNLIGSAKPQIRSKAQQQLGILNHKNGKLEEALNNFKQAIKADPQNMDARYNYEMLKKKMDEQKKKQEQDQQNRDKQNKDQKKDQQENKKEDQKQKEQDQKDQQKKEQEQKDQQKKEQEQKQKEQQQKEEQEKKDKDKDSKDQKDQKAKDEDSKEQKEEQEKKDKASMRSKKLQQIQMPEEKAHMILEAMKNQEIQYLQQNKRKATKQKDRTKPDW